ncbi:MAG TPA: electron transfer flavoprotein subunit alpha/FixB family protein [Spirochaetota bacterium]|nr:electron transfer flavoprotein subunit alpha/FixB family protein [Spirochaetota bacterium]
MSQIIVLIDHERGVISAHSRELATAAASLRMADSPPAVALIAGSDITRAAESFARDFGIDVTAIESRELEHYSAEGYLKALADIIPALSPSLVLTAHNARGCDFAPALAVRLELPCVTGAEEIRRSGGGWSFRRTAWHGKVREDVEVPSASAVVTVMPGAYQPADAGGLSPGKVTVLETALSLVKTSQMWEVPSGTGNAALSGAEVVVAAGRGAGSPERMQLVRELADLFPRSAVGGSRIACDMGLVDYGAQIGMTGKTVSPRLYIACGISGSAQHLAGMKNSRHIVAINRDPDAPIFRIADLGIVDNLEKFLPAFIAEAGKRRGAR